MNNRIWMIATAIVSVAILAIGFFLGVSPQLETASRNNAQTRDVNAINEAHELELASLKKQFESLDSIQAEIDALRLQLPPGEDYSAYLRQVDKFADSAGVRLLSVTRGDPLPFATGDLPAAGAVEPPAEGEETAEGEAPEAPVSDNPTENSNFVAIPVTFEISGDYKEFNSFVRKLQTGTRIYLATGMTHRLVTLTIESPDGETVTSTSQVYQGTVTGYIYVLKDDTFVPTEAEEEEEEEPEAEATPSPTDTPAPTETPEP